MRPNPKKAIEAPKGQGVPFAKNPTRVEAYFTRQVQIAMLNTPSEPARTSAPA